MSEDLYKVEKISNKKFCDSKQQWIYLVKWEGYDTDESTWEPEENLCYIPKLVESFNIKWQAKQVLKKKKKQQKLDQLAEIKKKRSKLLKKTEKESFREVVNSNKFLDTIVDLEEPDIPLPIPEDPEQKNQLKFDLIKGDLKKDKISKIIGLREYEGTLYVAVLFKCRSSLVSSIGVFRLNLLRQMQQEALGAYLIEKLKNNQY